MSYILNSAGIIAISLLFYRAFLHSETFFKLNRLVLLCCLLMAFIVPMVHVPAQFSFRNAVPSQTDNTTQIEVPIVQIQQVPHIQTEKHAKVAIKPLSPQMTINGVIAGVIRYVPLLYWAGVAIMGANLLLQIFVLFYRSRKNRVIKDGVCRIVEVNDDRAPCSFANSIYINPEKYDFKTYSEILAHEKIHVMQAHSIDLLLAEAMLIFQWFNPFAWIYRKDIERNLEYLTDDSVLKDDNFDRSDYQFSLLKVSVPHLALNITANYNQSMLKKRILMMNARRSSISGMWKYMMLILLMGILVCNINQPLAAFAADGVPFSLNKLTDAKNDGLSVIERQTAALPRTGSTLPQNNVALAETNNALKETPVASNIDTSSLLKFSTTKGRIALFYEGGTYKMPFPDELIVADEAFINDMSNSGYAMLDQSQMDSLKTAGVTPQFVKDIVALGHANLPYKMVCMLKLAKVSPEYIRSFADLGYGQLKISRLLSFKFSNIEAAYIKSMQRVGLNIPLELVTISKLRNLTPEYVQSFKDLGYADITYDRIAMWKLAGIDADFIRGFNKIGYANIPEADVSLLKIKNISPEYVMAMKDKGVAYNELRKYAFANR